MKKIFLISSACFSLAVGSLFAQSEIDALKYSKSDINGTARYMSMAGAFGALGADISTLANNPAGIGVYRSSEFAATSNLSNLATSSMWNGTSVDANNWKFNFNNIAYIGTFKPNVEGLVNLNFGIGFNRLKDFYRNYQTNNSNFNSSLTNYIAIVTNKFNDGSGILTSNINETSTYYPYDSKVKYPWISILGWNGSLIDPKTPSDINNNYKYQRLSSSKTISNLNISERGYLDEYNISFGGNIYDVLYFGGTLSITDLNYRLSSTYDEDFINNSGVSMNGYTLSNYLETRGSGVNLKAGVILRPLDFLRFGLSFHTPTFYKMTDYFDANVQSNYNDGTVYHDGTLTKAYVPENAFSEYSLQSPFKLQASTAIILGKMGILSFEYEYVDYSNMKMKDTNGYGWSANDSIIKHLNAGNNLKVGAEIRITPQLSLRGGFATQSPIVKANVINQKVEVNTLGATLPHYTLDKGTTYYTGGFGYRFGSYYTDFAFVSRQLSEDVYAFSPISNGSTWNVPEKATLKTTVNQVLFTFGVKF
ncbi:MAG: hypothetical protein WCJ03_02495 [Bacteroidales bacterium]